MLTEAQKSRLALARRLRESADRSEQELRDALSRSYYSVYQAARAWLLSEKGRVGHTELQQKVREVNSQLADAIRDLHTLREKADYDPDMVRREYGDVESFRLAVNRELERARTTYSMICIEIAWEFGE